MKVNCRRALMAASCLAALLMVSCELMSARAPRAEKEAVASKLSPANATYDLEDEGLKVYWQQELGQLSEGRSLRSIYVAGSFVVLETDDDIVHCLDSTSGEWRGTAKLPAKLDLPPVAVGDNVFFVCKNAILTFDVAHDRLSKPYHPGFPLFAKPVLYQDRLILGGGDGRIESIDLSGEDQKWIASLSGEVFDPPVVSQGKLYASAHGDKVIAWDLTDDLEMGRWGPNPPSDLSSGVAIYKDTTLFVGDDRGLVYALTTDFFQKVWEQMLDAPVIGQPQVIGERLLVLTSEPALVCFNAPEHKLLWKQPGVERILAAGRRGLYVLKEGNVLAVLSQETTGEPVWTDVLPKKCRVIGDPAQPVLYLANPAGSVLALKELD
jgi:outer membrane protein assembly factor BamB